MRVVGARLVVLVLFVVLVATVAAEAANAATLVVETKTWLKQVDPAELAVSGSSVWLVTQVSKCLQKARRAWRLNVTVSPPSLSSSSSSRHYLLLI